jgi:hypothetical protein
LRKSYRKIFRRKIWSNRRLEKNLKSRSSPYIIKVVKSMRMGQLRRYMQSGKRKRPLEDIYRDERMTL